MDQQELKAYVLKLINDEMDSSRYSKNYKAEINRHVRQFYEWTVKADLQDFTQLTKAELLSYAQWVTRQESKNALGGKLSISTMNNMLYAVKYIYSMLYHQGFIKENPVHGLDYKIKSGKKMNRVPLTQQQMYDFLEAIDISTEYGLRNRALFELIYSSGLRVSEAANLKIADIDFDRREAIVRGKFDRDRVVPLSHMAKDFLALYLRERITNIEQFVFTDIRTKATDKPLKSMRISRIFREYLRKFGMDNRRISAHSIRHSTATHLLDNGASIRHVQELLGHKNIETTVRYTHVQTESLAKIYRKYHPREHELFEAVDETYIKRLESLLES